MTRLRATGTAPWLYFGWLPACMAMAAGDTVAGCLISCAWLATWWIVIRYS